MSSKISNVDTRTGPVGAGRAVERVRNATTGAKSEGEQASSGEVQITGSARNLADLEQLVQGMPAIDESRVATISHALETGTYKVSPERVADGLMQIEQALAPLSGQPGK